MLHAHTVLDSVAMAYVPLWSRARELAGVRLCVRAIHPEGVDASHLLQAVGEDWPEGAPPLLLSLQTPRLLQQALSCAPIRNTALEVPASLFNGQETLSRLSMARPPSRAPRRLRCLARPAHARREPPQPAAP